MTTFILDEHRTRGKAILAQKVLGNEPEANTWKPYRVKVIETHDFKSEAACLAYFQKQKQEASRPCPKLDSRNAACFQK